MITDRLLMRRWRPDDRDRFAVINADVQVMRFFPAPLNRSESDALVDRIEAGFETNGFGLWALERRDNREFIGFTGLSVVPSNIPCAPAVEVGWRLHPDAWGQGFASEAARRALHRGFTEFAIDEIVSFTAAINLPSQRVMQRIGMTHDSSDDFDHPVLGRKHPLRPHVLYRITRSDDRVAHPCPA